MTLIPYREMSREDLTRVLWGLLELELAAPVTEETAVEIELVEEEANG